MADPYTFHAQQQCAAVAAAVASNDRATLAQITAGPMNAALLAQYVFEVEAVKHPACGEVFRPGGRPSIAEAVAWIEDHARACGKYDI